LILINIHQKSYSELPATNKANFASASFSNGNNRDEEYVYNKDAGTMQCLKGHLAMQCKKNHSVERTKFGII